MSLTKHIRAMGESLSCQTVMNTIWHRFCDSGTVHKWHNLLTYFTNVHFY